jgi:GTPase Era involved in 16S rRNA processing
MNFTRVRINFALYTDMHTQHLIWLSDFMSQSLQEGKALKLLATAARLDIEDFLQKKVYLEVQPL